MSSREFIFNGDRATCSVQQDGEYLKVQAGGSEFVFRPDGDNRFTTSLNGIRTQVAVVKHKGVYYIDVDSVMLDVQDTADTAFSGAAAEHGGAKDKVFAPMPGKIVKIMVNVGDQVSEKQPLVIVEAMKMENQVNARAGGKVKAINFQPGDQVDTETPIVELEL